MARSRQGRRAKMTVPVLARLATFDEREELHHGMQPTASFAAKSAIVLMTSRQLGRSMQARLSSTASVE
jgi:hypothetical protein